MKKKSFRIVVVYKAIPKVFLKWKMELLFHNDYCSLTLIEEFSISLSIKMVGLTFDSEGSVLSTCTTVRIIIMKFIIYSDKFPFSLFSISMEIDMSPINSLFTG